MISSAAVVARRQNAQPSGNHDVHSVARFAGAKKRVAAGEIDPIQLGKQVVQSGGIEALEKRRARKFVDFVRWKHAVGRRSMTGIYGVNAMAASGIFYRLAGWSRRSQWSGVAAEKTCPVAKPDRRVLTRNPRNNFIALSPLADWTRSAPG